MLRLSSCLLVFLLGCATSSQPDGKTAAGSDGSDGSGEEDGGTGADTAVPGESWAPELGIAGNCWTELDAGRAGFPAYDALGVVAGSCAGTRHQRIEDVERVVFLGDSITVGTPPTEPQDYFRERLSDALRARFGEGLAIESCAKFGARTDDYLREQVPGCFPEADPRRTLVIATMGGNDLFAAAEVVLEGGTEEEGLAVLERAVDYQREALAWFRGEGAALFPGGVDVVVGNVYEFTDTTGSLSGCELADTFGFGGQIDAVVEATQYLNTEWARIAVETQTDMLFMNEAFCGHGYGREDAEGPCYRGPSSPLWFDLTCIHPSPAGHAAIAGLFVEQIEASVADAP